jgi:hypothetical protein
VAQVGQRHFRPGGPGRGTVNDFSSRHFCDYSGAIPAAGVTPVLRRDGPHS